MIDALRDIQERLCRGEYRNEEHVRLNLVARLLQELGWNIWDPREVYPEFVVVPNEDATKVDLALFVNNHSPAVYTEIKACGKISGCLDAVETQVRDYNRNNTALFSVITEGQEWRLYYSQTGGEFKEKCFKIVNLARDDLAEAERTLKTFLSKQGIEYGNAKAEAEKCLHLNQLQRAMNDCLSEARRRVQEPPFPSLPDCLVDLVGKKGFKITKEDAISHIEITGGSGVESPPPFAEPVRNMPIGVAEPVRRLPPDNPGDLRWAQVLEGTLGGASGTAWMQLVHAGIRLALSGGISLRQLQEAGPRRESTRR